MKNLFSVCILVAFSVFPGCQKKKPPQAQAVAVETKKIEFEAREKGMAALAEDFTAGQSAFLSYLK